LVALAPQRHRRAEVTRETTRLVAGCPAPAKGCAEAGRRAVQHQLAPEAVGACLPDGGEIDRWCRLGLKRGLAAGLVLMAVGSAVIAEFATRRIYPGALAGLFTLGGGLALLQTAINPYVSILGPIESGAQRIALMGICNKFAGLRAPVILGVVVLHGLDALTVQLGTAHGAEREHLLNAFAAKIEVPYLTASLLLILTSGLVLISPLPAIRGADANGTVDGGSATAVAGLGFHQARHLWLGVACLFVYVGVEVMAGDAIGA
jgi:fucose permease